MHDTLPMRFMKSIANLCGIFQRLFQGQRTCERPAFDIFHHQVTWTDVIQRADVRMVQSSHGPSLALETLGESLVRYFDRNRAVESRITSFPHLTHSPGADLRKDL